jgi:hypothetical protein
MNNSEFTLRAIWDINDELIAEAENDSLEKQNILRVCKSRHFKIIAPAAAACLIIAFAAFAQPWYSDNRAAVPPHETPITSPAISEPADTPTAPNTASSPATDVTAPSTETSAGGTQSQPPDRFGFVGLPTRNLCLSAARNINVGNGARAPQTRLTDFFVLGGNHLSAFVFVRVTDARIEPYGNTAQRQIANVEILETVWNCSGNLPQTLTVYQGVWEASEDRHTSEPVSLLREGGVYLLTLIYSPWFQQLWGTDYWEINGFSHDVLFEVGDNGNVWSHSPHRGLNRFNNRPASELAEAIRDITRGEHFDVILDSFATRSQYSLVEVTVMSNNLRQTDFYGNVYDSVTLRVNHVHYTPHDCGHERRWRPFAGEVTEGNFASGQLAAGERFLMLVESHTGQVITQDSSVVRHIAVSPEGIARINADGRITQINSTHMNDTSMAQSFVGQNGRTPAELGNVLRRSSALAREWNGRHVCGCCVA